MFININNRNRLWWRAAGASDLQAAVAGASDLQAAVAGASDVLLLRGLLDGAGAGTGSFVGGSVKQKQKLLFLL